MSLQLLNFCIFFCKLFRKIGSNHAIRHIVVFASLLSSAWDKGCASWCVESILGVSFFTKTSDCCHMKASLMIKMMRLVCESSCHGNSSITLRVRVMTSCILINKLRLSNSLLSWKHISNGMMKFFPNSLQGSKPIYLTNSLNIKILTRLDLISPEIVLQDRIDNLKAILIFLMFSEILDQKTIDGCFW